MGSGFRVFAGVDPPSTLCGFILWQGFHFGGDHGGLKGGKLEGKLCVGLYWVAVQEFKVTITRRP